MKLPGKLQKTASWLWENKGKTVGVTVVSGFLVTTFLIWQGKLDIVFVWQDRPDIKTEEAVSEKDFQDSQVNILQNNINRFFDLFQNADLSEKIELWGVIVTIVISIATIIQIIETWIISRAISRSSALSEALTISKEIDEQWQNYNKLVITDKEFRKTLRSLENLQESDERTQLRHLIFFVLNIVYIAWTSEMTKKDKFDHSKTIIQDHLSILLSKKKEVLEILEGNRGYNQHFVDDCKQVFERVEEQQKHSLKNTQLYTNMNNPNMSLDQLIIRKASAEDWQSIQKLNLQIFEFELENCEPTSNTEYPFSDEGIDYFKKASEGRDGHSAIVAELQKQVIAYAIIKEIPEAELTHRCGVKQVQLHTLSVDTSYRDRGIGRKVLNEVINIAKEKGANKLKVVAYAPNDRARHLYRSNGFKELEIVHELDLL